MSVFFVLMIFMAFPVQGDANIELLIQEGYQVRSSDINRLSDIISELELQSSITSQQSDHLQYLQAYYNAFEGNYSKAIEQFEKVEKTAKEAELKYRALVTLVNVLGLNRKYKESYTYLNKLEKLGNEISNPELRDGALIASSYTYLSLKRYSLAETKASQLMNVARNDRVKCIASQIYLDAYFNLMPSEIRNNDVERALSICKKSKEPLFVGLIHLIEAKKLSFEGRHLAALELLVSIKELVSRVQYHRLNIEYHYLLSEVQYRLSDNENAKINALKVTKVARDESFEPYIMSYKLLAQMSKEEGKYKASNQYLESYIELEKAFFQDLANRELAYQSVKYELTLKNNTIESLNKENQLLSLKERLAKKESSNNKLLILLLFTIVCSLIFWSYRIKRNQMEFKRRSETDALTGVSSRFHFYSICRKILKDSESRGLEVSLILFDMDRFKSVNDKYGHLVGDWVLQKTIEVCRPCWRQNDIVGRLGGEEFALMLPGCDLEKATEIAESCRKAIEDVDTIESGHKFHISASFGVTTSKISGYEFSKLIGDADKIMYQAKAAGKNQVLRVAKKS